MVKAIKAEGIRVGRQLNKELTHVFNPETKNLTGISAGETRFVMVKTPSEQNTESPPLLERLLSW